jgi:L-malate glycosyltransferase
MKILHITNWYPNLWNPKEAPFIQEHFDSLDGFSTGELWHVQVRNEGPLFKIEFGSYSEKEHFAILNTRIKNWSVIERLHLLMLFLVKKKLRSKRFDLVNFHIAYPLLRFPRLVKKLFREKIVITEHWSAYKRGFFLPEGSKSRKRIEQIFHHKLPVITVSNALMQDIIVFAGVDDFPQFIIPNIVDTGLFYPAQNTEPDTGILRFLMVANWVPIKKPMLVLEAFKLLAEKNKTIQLSIIGYGTQWEAMQAFVQNNKLEKQVFFLGKKSKAQIAEELRKTSFFLHPSEYETFSVVCAEALCCGVPVIASKVGGIKEVVSAGAGILLENKITEWLRVLEFVSSGEVLKKFNPLNISTNASKRFSIQEVGKQYASVLEQIIHDEK